MSGKKAVTIIALISGCSLWVTAQSSTQEITLTPPRISEPWSESIGNDPSDSPQPITPGVEINTTPERAKEGAEANPDVQITAPADNTLFPARPEKPVDARPAPAPRSEEQKPER